MANTIELAKNYLDIIDEVYKSASVTADLTSDPSMMRAGANVSEILYPQRTWKLRPQFRLYFCGCITEMGNRTLQL